MRRPIFVLVVSGKTPFPEFDKESILDKLDKNESGVFQLDPSKVSENLDFINLLPEYVYFICESDEVCSPIRRLFFFTLTTKDVEHLGEFVHDLMVRFNEAEPDSVEIEEE